MAILVITVIFSRMHWIEGKSVQTVVIPPNKPYPGSPANETWGYSEVRRGSFLFWWLYKSKSWTTDPLIIYIHGGPGVSATAAANFDEVGPFDLNFDRRNKSSSWLEYASLVFVDAPVGTGFSFTTNPADYSFTKEESADDLINWFKDFIHRNPSFRKVPIHLFAESFATRFATVFADKMISIQDEVGVRLTGLTLISPYVSIYEYEEDVGRYLYSFSLVDDVQKGVLDSLAKKIADGAKEGNFLQASSTTLQVDPTCEAPTYGIFPLNILFDENHESHKLGGVTQMGNHFYPSIGWIDTREFKFAGLMNGPVHQYLKVPSVWGSQFLGAEIPQQIIDRYTDLLPYIDHVLTSSDIKVSVVFGQLDMFLNPLGQWRWIQRLKWSGKQDFLNRQKELFVGRPGFVQAYRKRHNQLTQYTVMNAGHVVPLDAPQVMLKVMRDIISY